MILVDKLLLCLFFIGFIDTKREKSDNEYNISDVKEELQLAPAPDEGSYDVDAFLKELLASSNMNGSMMKEFFRINDSRLCKFSISTLVIISTMYAEARLTEKEIEEREEILKPLLESGSKPEISHKKIELISPHNLCKISDGAILYRTLLARIAYLDLFEYPDFAKRVLHEANIINTSRLSATSNKKLCQILIFAKYLHLSAYSNNISAQTLLELNELNDPLLLKIWYLSPSREIRFICSLIYYKRNIKYNKYLFFCQSLSQIDGVVPILLFHPIDIETIESYFNKEEVNIRVNELLYIVNYFYRDREYTSPCEWLRSIQSVQF